MQLRRLEAMLYFPAVIIGGMMTLGSLAWLYEKTRRKIQHPRWGVLTHDGDHWRFLVPHYRAGEPAVSVEIPGTRKEPDVADLEHFSKLWDKISEFVEQARSRAIEDLQDTYDAVLGEPFEATLRPIVELVAADPQSLDAHWKLSSVSIHQGRDSQRYWNLEFEPSWDEEHQRSAYFDLTGKLLSYDLSVTVIDH